MIKYVRSCDNSWSAEIIRKMEIVCYSRFKELDEYMKQLNVNAEVEIVGKKLRVTHFVAIPSGSDSVYIEYLLEERWKEIYNKYSQ